MVINFDRLEEAQRQYSSDISKDTLQELVNIVLKTGGNTAERSIDSNYITAFATLSKMGIIESMPVLTEPMQLNS